MVFVALKKCRMIGEIGLKHFEFLPEIVPVLITVLSDATPAVARQAITCGIELFRSILEKVAIQVCFYSWCVIWDVLIYLCCCCNSDIWIHLILQIYNAMICMTGHFHDWLLLNISDWLNFMLGVNLLQQSSLFQT